jgi:hypothetical protein
VRCPHISNSGQESADSRQESADSRQESADSREESADRETDLVAATSRAAQHKTMGAVIKVFNPRIVYMRVSLVCAFVCVCICVFMCMCV